jgi:hypothetical protein
MKKLLSYHLLYVIFVLFAGSAYAQQIDSMMNVYAERTPPEKIHIHFDKSIYNKGETIWYKVYILHGKGGDSAVESVNLYLEWYDATGKPITQTASPIVLSTSSGSFEIPIEYAGESLQVRAFTRWMLNDDTAFNYRRDLVINQPASKVTGVLTNKTIVTAFPESGFLIQGLRTRVAFKAVNQYGSPVMINGTVVDDSNTIIDSLRVQHDGMGSFYLTPRPGQNYRLNWLDESGAMGSTAVPVSKTEGVQLSITREKDKALFHVERTDLVADNFKRMTMVVHMNRVGLYQVAINTTEKKKLSSELSVSDLPTGLLQFTLFTSDWIPVAERVMFINNGKHEFNVNVKASLVNVEKRAKNRLEVIVPDTLFSNMSMAITDEAVNPPEQHTIFSDILLSGEIKGKVHNPGYYLSGNSDSIEAHLDLVMLTHGWRRFDWEKIIAHIAPKVQYSAETDYLNLTGKVSGIKKNSPPADLNLIMLGKDNSRQFITTPVEKDGSFTYPIVFYDTAKLFFSFNNNKSLPKKAKLEINNGLLQLAPKHIPISDLDPYVWKNLPAKQNLDALLAQQELLRKLMSETTLKEVIVTGKIKSKLELLNEKYTSGYFKGNQARRFYTIDLVNIDKPVRELGVLQFLQNRVAGLIVNCPSILSCSVSWSRGGNPEFYLNESLATMDMILALPVIDIALVKAFPPPFMYSSNGMRNGAIAIYTKKMEDYKQPDLKGLPNLVLPGYTKFKEFYNPSYESPDANAKSTDNRTTLYWNPNLITNQTQQRITVDFFNNDFTKTFKVVLEGINAAGKMTRVERTINANTKIDSSQP